LLKLLKLLRFLKLLKQLNLLNNSDSININQFKIVDEKVRPVPASAGGRTFYE
jgi:hypothetical protein